MGKGGGSPLSMWIKEFCQLVFIQTIQALIYAIILSMVIQIMTAATTSTYRSEYKSANVDDYNSAIGLMCVFAFISVFKIEDLVKKVIGFGQTKADHRGALQSLAKTAFALKLGSKVLDNGGKVLKGVGGIAINASASRKDKINFENRRARLKAKYGMDETQTSVATSSSSSVAMPSETAEQGTAKQMEEITSGDTSQTVATATATKATTAKATTAKATVPDVKDVAKQKENMQKYKDELLNLQDKMDEKRAERSKKNIESVKMMTSGATEFVGSVFGGIAGGVIGIADGDIEQGIQGLVSGAGLGDAAGQFVNNSVYDLATPVSAVAGAINDRVTSSKKRTKMYDKASINAEGKNYSQRVEKYKEELKSARNERNKELIKLNTKEIKRKQDVVKAYKDRIKKEKTGMKDYFEKSDVEDI